MRFPSLFKPEYLFRPAQVFLRCRRKWFPTGNGSVIAQLPWGLPLSIQTNDFIGRQIWQLGVFDLSVTETLWRLIDPGDTVVDAGANIGYMSSVIAARIGQRGVGHAFEPHPAVFSALDANVRRWKSALGWEPKIKTHPIGLADFSGSAGLLEHEGFEDNHGRAGLADPNAKSGKAIDIRVDRLDNLFGPDTRVGVLKIDVEGHEIKVLRGGASLFKSGRVRDVVFEELNKPPTPVTEFFQAHGYTIFSVDTHVLRPVLQPLGSSAPPLRAWDTAGFLATLDAPRALSRFEKAGWHCLRGRPAK